MLHEKIEVSIANIPGVENLFMLANNAYDGGNFAEAHSYFSQVVALDSSFAYAWMGRGSSAGWQSTLAVDRFGECLKSYQQALTIGMSDSEKQAGAEDLCEIAIAFFDLAWGHMTEFKRNAVTGNLNQGGSALNKMANMAQDAQWNTALNNELLTQYDKCIKLLDSSLHLKKTLAASDAAAKMSQMCAGIVNKKGKEILAKNIDRYVGIAQSIDPDYTKPEKKKGCFVITATMGNPLDENVLLLQNFRDTVLLNGPIGRCLVDIYYKIGPTLADFIQDKMIIRKICRAFVVRPAVIIAKSIMDNDKKIR